MTHSSCPETGLREHVRGLHPELEDQAFGPPASTGSSSTRKPTPSPWGCVQSATLGSTQESPTSARGLRVTRHSGGSAVRDPKPLHVWVCQWGRAMGGEGSGEERVWGGTASGEANWAGRGGPILAQLVSAEAQRCENSPIHSLPASLSDWGGRGGPYNKCILSRAAEQWLTVPWEPPGCGSQRGGAPGAPESLPEELGGRGQILDLTGSQHG